MLLSSLRTEPLISPTESWSRLLRIVLSDITSNTSPITVTSRTRRRRARTTSPAIINFDLGDECTGGRFERWLFRGQISLYAGGGGVGDGGEGGGGALGSLKSAMAESQRLALFLSSMVLEI